MDPINPIAQNPESFVQTPTVPPVPEAPKNSSPIVIISMALFVLMSLGVVAFLYYQNQQLKSMLASYQTPIASPTPAATPDPTADWKTYTNTNDFSLKYPTTWTESGPVSKNDTTVVYITSDEKIGTGPEPLQYFLWVTAVTKLPDRQYSKESINGYTVYKTEDEPSRFGAIGYYFTKDEKRYIGIFLTPYNAVETATFPKQDEYVKTFNQILSTFKFDSLTPSASPSAVPTKIPVSTQSAIPVGY